MERSLESGIEGSDLEWGGSAQLLQTLKAAPWKSRLRVVSKRERGCHLLAVEDDPKDVTVPDTVQNCNFPW
jgi:hypothetical protein